MQKVEDMNMAELFKESKSCCCGDECGLQEEERKPKIYYAGIALFVIGVGITLFLKQFLS